MGGILSIFIRTSVKPSFVGYCLANILFIKLKLQQHFKMHIMGYVFFPISLSELLFVYQCVSAVRASRDCFCVCRLPSLPSSQKWCIRTYGTWLILPLWRRKTPAASTTLCCLKLGRSGHVPWHASSYSLCPPHLCNSICVNFAFSFLSFPAPQKNWQGTGRSEEIWTWKHLLISVIRCKMWNSYRFIRN